MRAGWGIPVNREQANNLVASSAEAMRLATGPMQLIVPPGARAAKPSAGNGLYLTAQQAGVPIVLAFVDYGRKVGAWGRCLSPLATWSWTWPPSRLSTPHSRQEPDTVSRCEPVLYKNRL